MLGEAAEACEAATREAVSLPLLQDERPGFLPLSLCGLNGVVSHDQMIELYERTQNDARFMGCVRSTQDRLSITLHRFQLICLYLLGHGHSVILQGPCGGGKSTIFNMLCEHAPILLGKQGKIIVIASTRELTKNQVCADFRSPPASAPFCEAVTHCRAPHRTDIPGRLC